MIFLNQFLPSWIYCHGALIRFGTGGKTPIKCEIGNDISRTLGPARDDNLDEHVHDHTECSQGAGKLRAAAGLKRAVS